MNRSSTPGYLLTGPIRESNLVVVIYNDLKSRDYINRRKRQFNRPQVPTCVVELFKIASNATYTLGEGFSVWQCYFVISIGSFYEILKSNDDYGGVAAQNRRRGFPGALYIYTPTGSHAFVIFKVDIVLDI